MSFFIKFKFSSLTKKLIFETITKSNKNFNISCSDFSDNSLKTVYFVLLEIDLLKSIMKMRVLNEDRLEICSKEGSPFSDIFVEKFLKFNIKMGSNSSYFLGYLENFKFFYRIDENFLKDEKISKGIYTECNSGYFSDELTNKCKLCNENCQTCNGSTSQDCLSCKENNFFVKNLLKESVGVCESECFYVNKIIKFEIVKEYNYTEFFNDGIISQNSFVVNSFSSNLFKDSMFPLIFEYLFNFSYLNYSFIVYYNYYKTLFIFFIFN